MVTGGDAREQGGLARAVLAHDAVAVAAANRQRRLLEQHPPREG